MPTKTKSRGAGTAVHAGSRRAAIKLKTKAARNGKAAHDIDTLRDLLAAKLQMLYDVENQIVKGLPKLEKKAADPDLREAMSYHLKQTEGHVRRLEEALAILEVKPGKLASEAIRGLSGDAERAVKDAKGSETSDAALIAALRAVEYYEVSAYGAAREWAELVGERQIADLLEETLHEEEEAADTLTDIALSKVNGKAAGEENVGTESVTISAIAIKNENPSEGGDDPAVESDDDDDEEEEEETEGMGGDDTEEVK